ncbi:MAG: hypothetical protein ACTHOP_12575 [Mesorhizobium sp.]
MNEAIQKAAQWLATTPERQRPHPIIPHLVREFGLSAAEAVKAIRESHLIKARAH